MESSKPTFTSSSDATISQGGTTATPSGWRQRCKSKYKGAARRVVRFHESIPFVRRIPLRAILIILFLILVNLVAWAICALVLTRYPNILGTAALAYSLGLRHALDADHISAIDLMTRRLIASGQRPVTVGTFFSLGHSTIVVITSIAVAATAAGISKHFASFSHIGGIIGSSVSAGFLILLGVLNGYILYKLILQLQKVIHMQPEDEAQAAFKFEGGGVLFRLLKKLFKIVDRPWKMYPLGVMFGLGFDTSSEVALLGIASVQGAKGTSMWLILVMPVLFTVGMCLLDTIDGALMMGLYTAPMGAAQREISRQQQNTEVQADMTMVEIQINTSHDEENPPLTAAPAQQPQEQQPSSDNPQEPVQETQSIQSPLTFLYYSSVLTVLTVMIALVIGTIQLLTLIRNAAISDDVAERSTFWQGVDRAGNYYDVIGGAICGAFIVFGLGSVACYGPWRRWVDRVRAREREQRLERGVVEMIESGSDMQNQAVSGGGIISEKEPTATTATATATATTPISTDASDVDEIRPEPEPEPSVSFRPEKGTVVQVHAVDDDNRSR